MQFLTSVVLYAVPHYKQFLGSAIIYLVFNTNSTCLLLTCTQFPNTVLWTMYTVKLYRGFFIGATSLLHSQIMNKSLLQTSSLHCYVKHAFHYRQFPSTLSSHTHFHRRQFLFFTLSSQTWCSIRDRSFHTSKSYRVTLHTDILTLSSLTRFYADISFYTVKSYMVVILRTIHL